MKVLVDTSVWIDHLRAGSVELSVLLRRSRVVTHEFIVGELLAGQLSRRSELQEALERLAWLPVLSHREFAGFVERTALAGSGLNLVDIHLLGSVAISPGVRLLTADRRLGEVTRRLAAN